MTLREYLFFLVFISCCGLGLELVSSFQNTALASGKSTLFTPNATLSEGHTHSEKSVPIYFNNLLATLYLTDSIPAEAKVLPFIFNYKGPSDSSQSTLKEAKLAYNQKIIALPDKKDSITIPISKDTLSSTVTYQAEDSIVLEVPTKTFHLYGKTTTEFDDISLKAELVDFDQATNLVKARYAVDSGRHVGAPIFNQQGQDPFQSDSMLYDFKLKQGKIYNTVSKQGEGFLYGDQVKRMADNSINTASAFFTTCDVDPPHFGFSAKKVKIIPDKVMISGPANLVVEGVPTPLYIPFAIFPLSSGQRTGLLPPTYETTEQKGMGLTNGGYYFGLGEYADLTVRGDIYSYGSWGMNLNPRYYKRYRYNGSMTFSMNTTRFGDPQTKDFTKSKDFRITWSHTMDPKAHPGTSFSANVNAGTSSYSFYNLRNAQDRLNNILSSSISFGKNWQGSPFNFTMSANHSQNTSTERVDLTLPTMSLNMNTIYPLQPAQMVGKPKWYEKLGIGYSLNVRNSVSVQEKDFLKDDFFEKFQTGVQHRVPISLTLPATSFLNISPSVSYSERWYTQKRILEFNAPKNRLDTITDWGFNTAREMSFGVSLSSSVYGMFQFNKDKGGKKKNGIQAIRHVFKPSISLNYKPDMNGGDYYNVRVDTSDDIPTRRLSVYQGLGFGPYSEGKFGGISFSLDNNLEMKVRSDKDTSDGGQKKVKILEGFGLTGSYNLVADSFKLSDLSLYARTTLFKKMRISANGTIDPYVHDSKGRIIDRYAWQDGKFSLGQLNRGSISMSTTFRSKEGEQKEQQIERAMEDNPLLGNMDPQQQLQDELRRMGDNPADYVDFSIPWSLNLSYSLNFRKQRTPDYKRDTTIFAQSLTFSGDFSLTPQWKITMSSGYDFRNNKLTYTTLGITRDLHCWRMSINVVPMGFYKSFSITISPSSSLLHDLKITRNRQFMDVFER